MHIHARKLKNSTQHNITPAPIMAMCSRPPCHTNASGNSRNPNHRFYLALCHGFEFWEIEYRRMLFLLLLRTENSIDNLIRIRVQVLVNTMPLHENMLEPRLGIHKTLESTPKIQNIIIIKISPHRPIFSSHKKQGRLSYFL